MKHLIVCLLLLCAAANGRACTVCGSSASNQYLGILPQYHKHFIGLQYQYRQFQSEHPGHGEHVVSTFSKEHYNTYQVWGRFNVGKHVQVFAFVPFINNQMTESKLTSSISGLGDITVLGNYRILNSSGENWQHSLQAGGGVKIPTGSYDKATVQESANLPNMQPGTGSWDVIVNTNFTTSYKNAGLNIDASCTFTTPNSFQYKYGNRLSTGMLTYYKLNKGGLTLLPQMGVRLDLASGDYDNYSYRWKNDMTGGTQWYTTIGLQGYYDRVGMQLMYHHPISQQYADGLVKTKFKAETGIYLLF